MSQSESFQSLFSLKLSLLVLERHADQYVRQREPRAQPDFDTLFNLLDTYFIHRSCASSPALSGDLVASFSALFRLCRGLLQPEDADRVLAAAEAAAGSHPIPKARPLAHSNWLLPLLYVTCLLPTRLSLPSMRRCFTLLDSFSTCIDTSPHVEFVIMETSALLAENCVKELAACAASGSTPSDELLQRAAMLVRRTESLILPRVFQGSHLHAYVPTPSNGRQVSPFRGAFGTFVPEAVFGDLLFQAPHRRLAAACADALVWGCLVGVSLASGGHQQVSTDARPPLYPLRAAARVLTAWASGCGAAPGGSGTMWRTQVSFLVSFILSTLSKAQKAGYLTKESGELLGCEFGAFVAKLAPPAAAAPAAFLADTVLPRLVTAAGDLAPAFTVRHILSVFKIHNAAKRRGFCASSIPAPLLGCVAAVLRHAPREVWEGDCCAHEACSNRLKLSNRSLKVCTVPEWADLLDSVASHCSHVTLQVVLRVAETVSRLAPAGAGPIAGPAGEFVTVVLNKLFHFVSNDNADRSVALPTPSPALAWTPPSVPTNPIVSGKDAPDMSLAGSLATEASGHPSVGEFDALRVRAAAVTMFSSVCDSAVEMFVAQMAKLIKTKPPRIGLCAALLSAVAEAKPVVAASLISDTLEALTSRAEGDGSQQWTYECLYSLIRGLLTAQRNELWKASKAKEGNIPEDADIMQLGDPYELTFPTDSTVVDVLRAVFDHVHALCFDSNGLPTDSSSSKEYFTLLGAVSAPQVLLASIEKLLDGVKQGKRTKDIAAALDAIVAGALSCGNLCPRKACELSRSILESVLQLTSIRHAAVRITLLATAYRLTSPAPFSDKEVDNACHGVAAYEVEFGELPNASHIADAAIISMQARTIAATRGAWPERDRVGVVLTLTASTWCLAEATTVFARSEAKTILCDAIVRLGTSGALFVESALLRSIIDGVVSTSLVCKSSCEILNVPLEAVLQQLPKSVDVDASVATDLLVVSSQDAVHRVVHKCASPSYLIAALHAVTKAYELVSGDGGSDAAEDLKDLLFSIAPTGTEQVRDVAEGTVTVFKILDIAITPLLTDNATMEPYEGVVLGSRLRYVPRIQELIASIDTASGLVTKFNRSTCLVLETLRELVVGRMSCKTRKHFRSAARIELSDDSPIVVSLPFSCLPASMLLAVSDALTYSCDSISLCAVIRESALDISRDILALEDSSKFWAAMPSSLLSPDENLVLPAKFASVISAGTTGAVFPLLVPVFCSAIRAFIRSHDTVPSIQDSRLSPTPMLTHVLSMSSSGPSSGYVMMTAYMSALVRSIHLTQDDANFLLDSVIQLAEAMEKASRLGTDDGEAPPPPVITMFTTAAFIDSIIAEQCLKVDVSCGSPLYTGVQPQETTSAIVVRNMTTFTQLVTEKLKQQGFNRPTNVPLDLSVALVHACAGVKTLPHLGSWYLSLRKALGELLEHVLDEIRQQGVPAQRVQSCAQMFTQAISCGVTGPLDDILDPSANLHVGFAHLRVDVFVHLTRMELVGAPYFAAGLEAAINAIPRVAPQFKVEASSAILIGCLGVAATMLPNDVMDNVMNSILKLLRRRSEFDRSAQDVLQYAAWLGATLLHRFPLSAAAAKFYDMAFLGHELLSPLMDLWKGPRQLAVGLGGLTVASLISPSGHKGVHTVVALLAQSHGHSAGPHCPTAEELMKIIHTDTKSHFWFGDTCEGEQSMRSRSCTPPGSRRSSCPGEGRQEGPVDFSLDEDIIVGFGTMAFDEECLVEDVSVAHLAEGTSRHALEHIPWCPSPSVSVAAPSTPEGSPGVSLTDFATASDPDVEKTTVAISASYLGVLVRGLLTAYAHDGALRSCTICAVSLAAAIARCTNDAGITAALIAWQRDHSTAIASGVWNSEFPSVVEVRHNFCCS